MILRKDFLFPIDIPTLYSCTSIKNVKLFINFSLVKPRSSFLWSCKYCRNDFKVNGFLRLFRKLITAFEENSQRFLVF